VALGAMLILTVSAPPAVLLWVLAAGTGVIVMSVSSLARTQRRGLHAHAGGMPHWHRAGWKPHTHPTRGERMRSRWDRWAGSATGAATDEDTDGGESGWPTSASGHPTHDAQ
jgi:hypothetical protein